MIVYNIHSMSWGNLEKTGVVLVADTNEGKNLTIATPYSEDSIIWEWVKEFPQDQIADFEYKEPSPEDTLAKIQRFLDSNPDVVNLLKVTQ